MKTNPLPAINPSLLNIVTPMGLEFQRTQLTLGEFTAKVYGVSKYPPSVEMGWLSKVSHMPGTVISQLFVPVDNTLLVEAISRNIQQNRATAESTRDPLTQKRAEKGAEDGERILTQIDQYGETVGYMTNLVMPFDNQPERFHGLCRRVQGQYSVIKCKIRPLPNLQKAAFQTLSPSHVPQEAITNTLQRMMPLSTFIGGFPFSSSGYNDRTGTWFARDMQGGMVILDLWKRDGDRTNTNLVILGVSGMGKSTAVKNIVISEYMMGTKIILLDPESEYKELSQKLHGDWINCGGGAGGRINPLHIRSVPAGDEDEDQGLGSLALHMKTLDIFFGLYLPGLNDMQRALLKEALVEVYRKQGITWKTDCSALSADDFPVMGDLYGFISDKAKGQRSKQDYEALAAQLHDIAYGADAFLWNGPTTIKTRSKVICLDTNDLQAASDRIKATQYFNILSWAWEQMSRDRNEKVLLVADEAYMMIDPNVPQSLVFLRNVAKRARKYEAGIAIVSHSVVDFLDPSVRMYGQALLDLPAYKILMGCNGKNLEELAKLYSLTDAEQELLYAGRRGEAIAMIGAKRLHVRFDIPDYRLEIMGQGGGR